MGRRWLERGVIVAAALATIATSPPRWIVRAALPPNDPAIARIVTVDATREPSFVISHHGRNLWPPPLAPATWPGKARYLVPAGAVVEAVFVEGRDCQGGSGFVCKSCGAPAGVTISATFATAATWKRAAPATPQAVTLPARTLKRLEIAVTASHPFHAWLEGANDNVLMTYGPTNVTITLVNHSDAPVPAQWTLHAEIEVACPDPAVACTAPATAQLVLAPPVEAMNDAP